MKVIQTHEPEITDSPCDSGECEWSFDSGGVVGLMTCDNCGAAVIFTSDDLINLLGPYAHQALMVEMTPGVVWEE